MNQHTDTVVTKVRYGFDGDAIGELPDPEEQAHDYAAALRAALESAYPGADISLHWNLRQSGVIPAGDRALVYTEADGWQESEDLDDLIQSTWERWMWAANERLEQWEAVGREYEEDDLWA